MWKLGHAVCDGCLWLTAGGQLVSARIFSPQAAWRVGVLLEPRYLSPPADLRWHTEAAVLSFILPLLFSFSSLKKQKQKQLFEVLDFEKQNVEAVILILGRWHFL